MYDLWSIGVDLRNLFTREGTLTPRWVLWLIEWLPDNQAIYAQVQGGPHHRGWTPERHVAVSTMELLADANYQRSEGKMPRPKRVDRPKQKRSRRTVTVAQLSGQG